MPLKPSINYTLSVVHKTPYELQKNLPYFMNARLEVDTV